MQLGKPRVRPARWRSSRAKSAVALFIKIVHICLLEENTPYASFFPALLRVRRSSARIARSTSRPTAGPRLDRTSRARATSVSEAFFEDPAQRTAAASAPATPRPARPLRQRHCAPPRRRRGATRRRTRRGARRATCRSRTSGSSKFCLLFDSGDRSGDVIV